MRTHHLTALLLIISRAASGEEHAALSVPSATPSVAATPALPDAHLDDLQGLLETKVTSVSRHAELPSEAPASVSVITAEEIRQHGFRTIGEALQMVPGMFMHTDRAFSYVGVRGFGLLGDYNTRVLILLDGHALNSQLAYAQSYLGGDAPVDMSAIERIEVIKGPASATYGPWAFFGVVNVVTKKGADVDGALLTGRVDSVFRREGSVITGRRFEGDIDVVASGRGLDAPGLAYDFAERGGTTSGTDYERGQSLYGRLGWKDFSVAVNGFRRVKGLPTAPYLATYDSDDTRYENRQWFGLANWNHQLSSTVEVQASAKVNEYAVDDFFRYDELLYIDRVRERWQSGEVSASYSPTPATRMHAGITGSWHQASSHSFYDDGSFDIGYRKRFDTQLGYAVVERKFASERLELTAGATLFRHSIFGSRVTPRTGVIAKPAPATTLKLLYGEGFRPPSLGERYYDDGFFFLANPDVGAETVRTLETAIEHVFAGRVRVVAAAHRDWYDELIREREIEVDGVTRVQFQNDSAIDSYGTESALHADLGRGWSARMGHAWSVATSEDGAPLNFAAHILNGGVRGPIAPGTYASLAVSWVDRRRRERTDDEVANGVAQAAVPAAFLVNAGVRTEGWGNRLGIQVGVRNLLNRRITDPIVADHKPIVQIDQEARTFHVAIDCRF